MREGALLEEVNELVVVLLKESEFCHAIAIHSKLDSEITVHFVWLQQVDGC